MTLGTTTNRIAYSGNDSTTAFAVPYLFFDDDDLTVILTDAAGTETTQVITTDYTVTGDGEQSGGTVTMITPPATGETLTILREVPYTQGLDLVENDPFPSDLVEEQFDILTMLAQQNKDLIDRSFVLSEGDVTGVSTILPTPVALRALRWNSGLTALENIDLTTLGVTVVSDNTPSTLAATGSPGTSADVSRADHVHEAESTLYKFTPTAAQTLLEGEMAYNSDNNTFELKSDIANQTLQIGHEAVHRVRNQTGVTVTNGQVVYINGATGNLNTVALARANARATAEQLGVATHDIAHNAQGFITLIGDVNEIDTSSFSEGDIVYLSAAVAGGLTTTKPSNPNYAVKVGHIARSHASLGVLTVISNVPVDASDVLVANQAEAEAGTDTTGLMTPLRVAQAIAALTAFAAPDFTSSEQTVANDTALSIAHGLGALPTLWTVVLRCTTADAGYAIDDEIPVTTFNNQSNIDAGITASANDTNIQIVTGINHSVINFSTKNSTTLTVTSWRFVARAWS